MLVFFVCFIKEHPGNIHINRGGFKVAIKTIDEMDFTKVEMPRRPTRIPTTSDPKALREAILQQNPEDTPILDPAVKEELPVIQNLKMTQLNIQEAPGLRHMAGIKTKVIWYNQAAFVQNTDIMNSGGLNSVDGRKYNRIDNMVIVTDSELSQSFTVEDDGTVKNIITASGMTYPGVSPYPNDFFFVYEGEKKGTLYHVTGVEPVSVIEGGGFKIEFEKYYEQMDPDQMGNLVEGMFVFNFEFVGTKNNVVVERTMFELYAAINLLFTKVSEEYISRFYDGNKNIIRYKYRRCEVKKKRSFIIAGEKVDEFGEALPDDLEGASIFDPYVMHFISTQFRQTKLSHEGYSIVPTIPVWIDEQFKEHYKYTIFNAFSKRDPKLIKYHEYGIIPFNPRSTKEMSYSGWYKMELLRGRPVDRVISLYPRNFVAKICSGSLYTLKDDMGEEIKYNLFINFINDKGYIPMIEDIKAFDETVESIPDNMLYGIGPLLLFVLSYYKDVLLSKTL
jgi:hypothetical protein